MNRIIIDMGSEKFIPKKEEILKLNGIPAGVDPGEQINKTCDEAIKLFKKLQNPKAIFAEISIEEFFKVYEGEGKNSPETPLHLIAPKGEFLFLFAVTAGLDLSKKIEELFKENRYSLGSLLDSTSSIGVELIADRLEIEIKKYLNINYDENNSKKAMLRYSPGYCGWHVTGQKNIFKYLKPEEVGITLSETSIMTPTKSISGVIIYGKKEIHYFENSFDFCAYCQTYSCRERIDAL